MTEGDKTFQLIFLVPSEVSSLLVKYLILHITLHVSGSYKSGVLVQTGLGELFKAL